MRSLIQCYAVVISYRVYAKRKRKCEQERGMYMWWLYGKLESGRVGRKSGTGEINGVYTK